VPEGDPSRPPVGELVLAPDPARAVAWAVLALVLVAITLALAVTSDGGTVEWIGAGIAIAVAVFFVVPIVAPHLTTLVLDGEGVTGRSYHTAVEVSWDVVHVARVVRVAGEPLLELHVRERSPIGDPWRTRAVGILLPIGADIAAVEEFLAHRPGPTRAAR
jgi:hypothetical protein